MRNVDLYRADLVAGPAKRGGKRQLARLLQPDHVRHDHRADRARINPAIGPAPHAAIDRAGVQARAATDAEQAHAGLRVGQNAGPAVVDDHDVQLAARRGAMEQVRVGRQFLAGSTAGQQVQELRQVMDAGNDLLDAHQGHVERRRGRRKAGVALVLDDDERARVGDAEVAARHPHVGLDELFAEVAPGDGGQRPVLGGVRFAKLFGEQPAHVLGRQMQGRRDDVRRALAGQLHQVFAQVGLQRPNPHRGEGVVQLHLFADHRLRLDHRLDVVLLGNLEHDPVGLFRRLGPVDRGAPGGDVLLELDEQLVKIADRVVLDPVGRRAPLLEVGNLGDQLLVLLGRSLGRNAHRLAAGRLVKTSVFGFQKRRALKMHLVGARQEGSGFGKGFRVQGSGKGFRVREKGFRVQGSGFSLSCHVLSFSSFPNSSLGTHILRSSRRLVPKLEV